MKIRFKYTFDENMIKIRVVVFLEFIYYNVNKTK